MWKYFTCLCALHYVDYWNTGHAVGLPVSGNCSTPYQELKVNIDDTWKINSSLTCYLYSRPNCEIPPHLESANAVNTIRSLSVFGERIKDPGKTYSPQLTTQWSTITPVTLGGFYIKITEFAHGNETSKCFLLDLNGSRFDEDTTMMFEKRTVKFTGGRKYLYRLDLYSLPWAGNTVIWTQFFTIQTYLGETQYLPRRWQSFLSYDTLNYTEPATISLKFSQAPVEYGVQEYYLQLLSDTDTANAVFSCVASVISPFICQNQTRPPLNGSSRMVDFEFDDIPAGGYRVQVQLVDPFPNDNDKCLCYRMTGPFRECGQGCVVTTSANITVHTAPADHGDVTNGTEIPVTTGSDPRVTDITPQVNITDTQIAAISGGVVGVVLLLVIMFGIYMKQSGRRGIFCCRSGKEYTLVNGEKQITMLCTKDNEFHSKVVSQFAIYLQHFHCKVVFSSEDDLPQMTRSDFILVVDSQGALDALKTESQAALKTESQAAEIVNLRSSLSHIRAAALSAKCLCIHFEYTQEECVLIDNNINAARYAIPQDLKAFLFRIRAISVEEDILNNNNHDFVVDDDPWQIVTTTSKDNIKKALNGLKDAINKAKRYPRVVSHDRDNPVFDPEDCHSVPPTGDPEAPHDARGQPAFYPPHTVTTGVSAEVINERLADFELDNNRDKNISQTDGRSEVAGSSVFSSPSEISSDTPTSEVVNRLESINRSSDTTNQQINVHTVRNHGDNYISETYPKTAINGRSQHSFFAPSSDPSDVSTEWIPPSNGTIASEASTNDLDQDFFDLISEQANPVPMNNLAQSSSGPEKRRSRHRLPNLLRVNGTSYQKAPSETDSQPSTVFTDVSGQDV